MPFTPFPFFLVVCTVLVLYFIGPRKYRLAALLIASCAFCLSFGMKYILYVPDTVNIARLWHVFV